MSISRIDVLPALFATVRDQQLDRLPSMFTERPVWEMKGTRAGGAGAEQGKRGKLSPEERVTLFKEEREKMADEPKLAVHHMVEGNETLIARLSNHGLASQASPAQRHSIFFLEFEPGTSRVKRVVEMG
ncbi:hypothetical protein JCM10213_008369 [Rhodosporidiobolus nylandii]